MSELDRLILLGKLQQVKKIADAASHVDCAICPVQNLCPVTDKQAINLYQVRRSEIGNVNILGDGQLSKFIDEFQESLAALTKIDEECIIILNRYG